MRARRKRDAAANCGCRPCSALPRQTPAAGRSSCSYFGSTFAAPCDGCDNCRGEGEDVERTDVTVAAQKFLSCVARTGQRFGITHVIKVLRGSGERKLLSLGHDKLSTYGIGMEFSATQWKELARHFINQGLMEQDLEYGTLRLTQKARDVFQGEPVTVVLQQTRQAAAAPVAYDSELFNRLRRLRKEWADAADVPAYVILSDRSLVEMAAHYPQNETQLLAMHGIGEAKLARYGTQLLDLIRSYSRGKRSGVETVRPVESVGRFFNREHRQATL